MRHERTAREGWDRRAGAAGLALGAALTGAAQALAELPAFGMMTVARTRDGRAARRAHPAAVRVNPGCRLTASFVDAQGRRSGTRRGG